MVPHRPRFSIKKVLRALLSGIASSARNEAQLSGQPEVPKGAPEMSKGELLGHADAAQERVYGPRFRNKKGNGKRRSRTGNSQTVRETSNKRQVLDKRNTRKT